jgi:hypothetical protein
MTSLRLPLAALVATALLSACNPFNSEHIDSKYPSVSQQDAYDVSWGLQPRKVRGNPKMRYQYNSKSADQSGGQSGSPPVTNSPTTPTPQSTAPIAAPTTASPISTAIPSNLR